MRPLRRRSLFLRNLATAIATTWALSAGASCSSSNDSSSPGGGSLPACVGTCEPSVGCTSAGCTEFLCNTDADCPASRNYEINGKKCVTVCSTLRLCRDPCTTDSDCGKDLSGNQLVCNTVADDGTRYCDGHVGTSGCTSDAQCGPYTRCYGGYRPLH